MGLNSSRLGGAALIDEEGYSPAGGGCEAPKYGSMRGPSGFGDEVSGCVRKIFGGSPREAITLD